MIFQMCHFLFYSRLFAHRMLRKNLLFKTLSQKYKFKSSFEDKTLHFYRQCCILTSFLVILRWSYVLTVIFRNFEYLFKALQKIFCNIHSSMFFTFITRITVILCCAEFLVPLCCILKFY